MECADVVEAVRLGEESQEIYDHLAQCPSCRAKIENTQFVDGKNERTDKRPPAAVRSARMKMVAIAAGVLVPTVVIGSVALVVFRKKAPPESPPVAVAPPAAPKVTPVAPPPPAPAAPAPSLRKLTVDAQPPGTLWIDGKKRGETPATVEVTPGRVLVEVRAVGYYTAHKVVQIGDEDPKPLAFTLQPHGEGGETASPMDPLSRVRTPPAEKPAKAEAPPKPKDDDAEAKTDEPKAPAKPAADDAEPLFGGFGFLTISSEPKFAKVFVDGKDTGRTTPVTRLTTPAGKHKVELRGREGSATVEVTVQPRKEIEIDKELE